ncbi:MAG: PAS domain S-box protein [Longimicrobiaceae bacterium]
MTATQAIPQPVARPVAPFTPPSPRTAFQAPPPAVPRAVAAAIPAAAAAPTPLRGSTPTTLPPAALAEVARARWGTRVTSASMVVIAACALTGTAAHALASSAAGNEVLVVGAIGLVGAALEGWRRAWSLRSEVLSMRSALRVARETERWHRAVVDDVNDAVLVASPEGRMVEVNQAATVLLGQDRDSLLGRRLWDLLPLDDRLVALRRGDMVVDHGGGLRRLLRPDGSVVAADVSWSTLDDGRIIYLARRFGQW